MSTDEDGFTLIELILSIAILTVIISSLTLALTTFLTNGTQALERDDHSAGAATTVTYFDRDVASADTVVLGGSTCSGTTNVALLSWYEYSASSAAPSPAPGANPYRTAYTVVTDTSSVPVGGGTRFKLQRVSCLGATVLDRTDLVLNLLASTKASAALSADTSCRSSQALTLTVKPYDADVADDYAFRACTKTRLST